MLALWPDEGNEQVAANRLRVLLVSLRQQLEPSDVGFGSVLDTSDTGRVKLRAETVWSVFERERASLVPYQGPFDGFHAVTASVSKTCLVRCDGNRYSVMAKAVGRPVEVHAYADRVVIRQDGEIVGEHPRRFGRDQTIYDPWHYVPVLARKPGAWRNGAPFKDWVLPGALERVRKRLGQADDGGRQMVEILSAVITDGVGAVESACAEALGEGVCSADVILNILARRRDVERDAQVAVLGADFLHRGNVGEAGFILELLVGADDAFNVVVGQKTLGAFAGDFVDGVDEQDFIFPRLGLGCPADDHARLHRRVVEKIRPETEHTFDEVGFDQFAAHDHGRR